MSVTTFTTVNGRILRQNKDGVVHNFVSDPLGSVVMVRDTSGNTVYEAEYDPYGNVQSETGTNPSGLGYVGTLGYIKDSASSMYVRARYLLNNLGRWLTKDPLWPDEAGYVYAGAAPSQVYDPSGKQTTSCCDDNGAWFKDRASHCRSGWTDCPSAQQANCDGLIGSRDCVALADVIRKVAGSCMGMCSQAGGGGYNPNDPWDAATHCCVDCNGRSHGCGVKCCSASVRDYMYTAVGRCALSCLMHHEKLHMLECSSMLPVKGKPPYNECCAYYGQVSCLMKQWNKHCKSSGSPSPNVGKCIEGAWGKGCSSRYS